MKKYNEKKYFWYDEAENSVGCIEGTYLHNEFTFSVYVWTDPEDMPSGERFLFKITPQTDLVKRNYREIIKKVSNYLSDKYS